MLSLPHTIQQTRYAGEVPGPRVLANLRSGPYHSLPPAVPHPFPPEIVVSGDIPAARGAVSRSPTSGRSSQGAWLGTP